MNARCKVLRGQVERADGGLYYGNAVEFIAALDYLLDHPDAARQLGRQGLAYVDREYRWPTVIEKIDSVLRSRLLGFRFRVQGLAFTGRGRASGGASAVRRRPDRAGAGPKISAPFSNRKKRFCSVPR